ncbi:MAG TPA: sulfite exporter TauE/SafE family protein [Alphaproteobacteria bacterium]|nr:sulfite exporter TauE/SafE family protein [Alphaproteobacteria bacterium]
MDSVGILSAIGGCFHQITLSYGLTLSLFTAGLVGSVTHCVVMCGPFVMSQAGDVKKIRDAALIPYHLGRMTTYVFMAVLVHSVFSLVFVYSDLKSIIAAPMLLLAGLIFLVSAFPQMKILFPWIANIRFAVPEKIMRIVSKKLPAKNNVFSRYGLGILLGFMPCGLVVAALIASATAGTIGEAAIAMTAFTIGTIPALILVAIGGSSLKQKYPEFSLRFSQLAKVVSALWLFTLAGTMIL